MRGSAALPAGASTRAPARLGQHVLLTMAFG